jgi:hypothetical protein
MLPLYRFENFEDTPSVRDSEDNAIPPERTVYGPRCYLHGNLAIYVSGLINPRFAIYRGRRIIEVTDDLPKVQKYIDRALI